MRLVEFTLATIMAKKTKATILKDYQPYIIARNGWESAINSPFWRGLTGKTVPPKKVTKVKTRMNRQPLNTDNKDHFIADRWFQKHFGIRYRSSAVFVTGNYSVASSYGEALAVFPIGQFHYCWFPRYVDLYAELQSRKYRVNPEEYDVEGILGAGNYEQDYGINNAVERQNEVMIACDSYYLVPRGVVLDWREMTNATV